MEIGVVIYIAINILTFILYAMDKLKAIRHSYRIPEKVLLTVSFFGPVGAFLSMETFRHKTRKRKFTVSVSIFLMIHICIFVYLFFGGLA